MQHSHEESKRPNYKLKRARQLRGWSQADVAAKIDTARFTVSRWELGTQIPSPHFRQQLCDLFQMNAEELGLIEESGEQKPVSVEAHSEERSSEEPYLATNPVLLSQQSPPFEEAELLHPEVVFGRDQELQWILQRLHEGQTSVLYGMGGIGKTALAAEAIHRMREKERFRDGIVVELCQEQGDAAIIVKRILARFDPPYSQVQMPDRKELLHASQRLLGNKDVLIVLDNVEIERGLDLNDVLIPLRAASPTLLLLTRAMPTSESISRGACLHVGLLSKEHALELFAHSYGRQTLQELTSNEYQAAEHIVAGLGRHTLAVKLAGAYAGDCHLDLRRFAAELQNPQQAIERLAVNERSTLATVLGKSVDALPDGTRQLFIALAAFSSTGCGRQAAIAVGTALHLARPREHVDRLIRRALVEAWVNDQLPEENDCERLRLHPLIFALAMQQFEQLPAQQRDEIQQGIAIHYARYVKKASEEAIAFDENTIIDKLLWAYEHERHDLVLSICLGMQYFWRDQWHLSASLTYLPWGIAAARAIAHLSPNPGLYQQMLRLGLSYSTVLLLQSGKLDHAEQVLRSMVTTNSASNEAGECTALFFLGVINLLLKQPNEATVYFHASLTRRHQMWNEQEWPLDYLTFCQIAQHKKHMDVLEYYYQEALHADRATGNRRGEAVVLYSQAMICRLKGNLNEAQQYFSAAIAIASEVWQGRAFSFERRVASGVMLGILGDLALQQGDLSQAEIYLPECLKLVQEIRGRREEAWARCYLGRLALARDQLSNAKDLYNSALDIARKGQDSQCEGEVLSDLGKIAELEGRIDEAESLQRRSLSCRLQAQDGPGIAESYTRLGQLLIEQRSDYHQGCALLSEAINHYQEMGFQQKEQAIWEIARQLKCYEEIGSDVSKVRRI